MTRRMATVWAPLLLILLVPLCGFGPQDAPVAPADWIVTAAPAYAPLAALHGGERFPKGAELLRVRDGKAELLVPDFAATADASVSFDGKAVLFSGKKAAGDSWQIYELTLGDHAVRKVPTDAADAIRPLYLPAGHMVYAQRVGPKFELRSAPTGSTPPADAHEYWDMSPAFAISHLSANAIPSDVLADGRILFEAGYPLGTETTPELYLVYSDGSGVESYRCDHGRGRWAGRQLASGDVIFTHGATLARFTSPLAHETHVTAPQAEYEGGIAETADGGWLVSAKAGRGAQATIRLWRPGAPAMQTALARTGEDLVEPVLLAPHARPHRHPSGLHPWDYANLLVLDARLSREGDLKTLPTAVRLETQDANGQPKAMGTAPVEKDGSFFVKVPGDRPIRLALVDAKGTVLRTEHGWFWARGGEQRICVGCHTGPERASDNRVPGVLLRTTTPADLTGAGRAKPAGGR